MSTQEFQHPKEPNRLSALHTLQLIDTPIEERFERITRLACKVFNVPICAISCVDEHSVWFKAIQGLNACSVDRNVTFCQHAILSNGPFVINDARLDERFDSYPAVHKDASLVFYAGAPILSIDELPIATFCMMDTEPREFEAHELEMLEEFAQIVQHELHISGVNMVQDELIRQVSNTWRRSLIDPLTRLWNHEGIHTLLEETLNQTNISRSDLLVISLDLTRFHEINNTLGQVAGDELLQAFAKMLLRELREEHIYGRLCSNQFAIIINTLHDLEAVQATLDRIQQFVQRYPITGIKDRMTLGGALAGVYIENGCNTSSQDVFEKLDDALYTAKLLKEYQLVVMQCADGTQQVA